jgi:signal transduction histidine kinase
MPPAAPRRSRALTASSAASSGTVRALPRGDRSRSASIPDSFFRDVVGSMRNGVVVITRKGRLAFMNDEAYRTLGLRRGDDDLTRPFTEVLQGCHDLVRILASAFELNHLPNRAELRLRTTGKVIGYTVCLVRNDAGEVTGAALLFKDLTRVEQLEERERLRDRLAALGEMAAAIAHEVKNPLAGIEVMAGLLKRRMPASSEAQELLTDIINEAKMANAIVLEILEFVRPIRLQVEPVGVAAAVEDAISMAGSLVPRGGVVVDVHLDEGLPPVEADAHQLRQLLTNLLTNAFEALCGSGRVRIAARVVTPEEDASLPEGPPQGYLVIDVADDGPGVPEEIRDRIFSPFFTTKPRGSGLGLAIVRKIVDAHEGRIDVRVGTLGGTTVRVTVPVQPEPQNGGASERGAA